MIPALFDLESGYDLSKVKFLGYINHCSKCIITEERNGKYILELETDLGDYTAKSLTSQKLILCKARPSENYENQYFEIYKTERTTDGKIKVYANHIKQWAFQFVTDGDGEGVYSYFYHSLSQIIGFFTQYKLIPSDFPFTLSSDIVNDVKRMTLGITKPEKLGNVFLGKSGSFCDLWNCEIEYNNKSIKFLKRRGKATQYSIRYGKNIFSTTQAESCENLYTHILPFATNLKDTYNNSTVTRVFSEVKITESKSKRRRVLELDCSSCTSGMEFNSSTGVGFDDICDKVSEYVNTYINDNAYSEIETGLTINSEAQLDDMQNFNLCDTVYVILNAEGDCASQKITETKFDVLTERWSSLKIGNIKNTLSDYLVKGAK